jgi:hypothetical protein
MPLIQHCLSSLTFWSDCLAEFPTWEEDKYRDLLACYSRALDALVLACELCDASDQLVTSPVLS